VVLTLKFLGKKGEVMAENRQSIRKVFLFMLSVVLGGAFMLSGCENRPSTNIDEAEKVALQYMKDKYNVLFDIESCNEKKESFRSDSVLIEARLKLSDSDTDYIVDLKPSFFDEDKDGFYDSYIAISDNYMCDIMKPMIKEDMDDVLKEAGFDNFVSCVENITQDGIDSGHGFLSDFPVITNNEFDLESIMCEYDLNFYYQIHIPISESDNQIKNRIISSYTSLFSADFVCFHIYMYSDEDFVKINERINNDDFNASEFEILDETSFNLS